MWYVCDVLYAMLYVHVNCFVLRGCAVSKRYINVCNSDVFSVVNMYLDHLKFCAVCSNGRRYVCCSECYVVSNECDEPTLCLVQPIGAHGGEVMYFESFCFRGELGFLNLMISAYVLRNSSLSSSSLFYVVCVVMWSSLVCL